MWKMGLEFTRKFKEEGDKMNKNLINLKEETLAKIEMSGHSPEDVLWVGLKDGSAIMEWSEFLKKADRLYDNGYGWEYVNLDLVVVFKDGSWLERQEYDGSEWWRYKATPVAKSSAETLSTPFVEEHFPSNRGV